MNDAELIVASQTDPRRFRELYDRWAEPLLVYFYRRVVDAEVAADLLAETVAVAYERRHTFRDLGRPGGAWLYGIAAKELSHFFRRQEVERRAIQRLGMAVPELDEESITLIEALAGQDDDRHRALATALDHLPAGERRAVELRIVEDLRYRDIAERLECTEGAARTRVHRGLAKLNNLMQMEATS